jgi:peptide chain release factor 3
VLARWTECEDRNRLKAFQQENGGFLANDAEGHLTFLAPSEWRLEFTMKAWPEVTFHKTREHS